MSARYSKEVFLETIKWTDVLQAFGSIGAMFVAIIGFALLIYQIKQIERTIIGDTHGKLYAQAFEIMKLIAEHPQIRPYLYDNKDYSKEDPNYNQIMCFAEILADFLEHISLQKLNMSEDIWPRWEIYIKDCYTDSRALREYFEKYSTLYGDDILNILGIKNN
jgi:hypothetical protein